jgi:superfamily II DNA or RNA helicase
MAAAPLPIAAVEFDLPVEVEVRLERLVAAIRAPRPAEGYLPLAEETVAACPAESGVLILAATAAVLDGQPRRALVFLKRHSKRYFPSAPHHLLHALALNQEKKRVAARALLEQHGLAEWSEAYRAFAGGHAHVHWLLDQVDAIMGREPSAPRRRGVWGPSPSARGAGAAPKKNAPQTLASKTASKSPAATKPRRVKGAAEKTLPAAPAAAPAVLPLARVEINIPCRIDIDLEPMLAALAAPPESDGRWWKLRERFAHLSLAQGFDELLCLPHLVGVEPLWHQIETVRKVLKQFRGRVLLADEVGLGKTIEAGMALKEYALRGMAEQVLVLTPASLVGQWREELETKFAIASSTTHDALFREDPASFWKKPRIIASIAAARRQEHADNLRARQFDLVIVDEAHHLRDRASRSWQLVDALNKRFLLLLSATPVQNDLVELYNLLTLLKPGIFKTLTEFRAAYMTPGKPRQPANAERLRELMRGAMIRNTRAVVAVKLPRRHATTIRVEGSPAERAAYADLAAAVRRLAGAGGPGRNRLALQNLLTAAGSSPAAAAAALDRFAARRPDDPVWRELTARWAALGTGAKEAALIDLLQRNAAEKKLVFVHARETLARLAALLTDAGIPFAQFHGGLSGPDKDAAIADFRERAPVLLCTESGGEGRNIQFCNTLINFDLPWNPMAIEQRVGRIDRIGQSREVFVFNLVARGTLEDELLTLLDEKIAMFELVVGEVGAILGSLEEEREFPDLVLEAWLEASEAGRSQAFDELGLRLGAAKGRHEDAKALDEALFGDDFETA